MCAKAFDTKGREAAARPPENAASRFQGQTNCGDLGPDTPVRDSGAIGRIIAPMGPMSFTELPEANM